MIDAAMERIGETDGSLNALPTLCEDRGRDRASNLAPPGRSGAARGYLYGLPIAIKDLTDVVAGVRTTYGSPIFADHVPEKSDLLVRTLESRGGVVLAKSNTPEFGAGANTFQRGLRQDPQPVGHVQNLRRLVRRIRDGACRRAGLARFRAATSAAACGFPPVSAP